MFVPLASSKVVVAVLGEVHLEAIEPLRHPLGRPTELLRLESHRLRDAVEHDVQDRKDPADEPPRLRPVVLAGARELAGAQGDKERILLPSVE